VAALQLLLEMQQGAVISPEELQQLPRLNARGGTQGPHLDRQECAVAREKQVGKCT
jgi:hypothetical protein